MPESSSARKKTRATARTLGILIVDGHPLTRRGIRAVVEDHDLGDCHEATDAATALAAQKKHRPDLITLELTHGPENGFDLLKQIVAHDSNPNVLIVSALDEKVYAERCLHSGARGYINRGCELDKLTAAIRTVGNGEVYLSPAISNRILKRTTQSQQPISEGPIERLTDRELQVFRLIGEGRTTREVADDLHLSPKTIETHRAHIKEKVGAENNNQLIKQAVQWVMESS
ncbi:MAG: response regulator transcription factor [Phycisphaeraceae bacterium]|nr:response regulator transcription factor [Phycisphaeraceae bacterium]